VEAPLEGKQELPGKTGWASPPMRWRRSTGKKIGDALGITGKAYVDRTTAALRYYGLLEYQGVGKERE